MMEEWNGGTMEEQKPKRLQPNIPSFQYSIIPVVAES
jgi:hypothetical protein